METARASSLLLVQPPSPTIEKSNLSSCQKASGAEGNAIRGGSKFAQLAPELLIFIISYLDSTEKARLVVTCQHLGQLVEPLLYRHLDPDDSWESCRRIQLFKTLGKRQDLLPCIRSFRGLLVLTSSSRPDQPIKSIQPIDLFPGLTEHKKSVQDEWLAISMPLLAQVINIRDLELKDSIQWELNGSWESFKNMVSNMKLHRLALSGASNSKPLDLTTVLRGQPELTQLELNCPAARLDGLKEADVPNLEFFKGTLLQAATVVPGRPVRRLALKCKLRGPSSDCKCHDELVFQKVLLSSETITEFKIHYHRTRDDVSIRDVVQIVAKYLPKLVKFAIVVKGYIPPQTLLDEIPRFSSLGHLMLLDIDYWTINAWSADPMSVRINNWEGLKEKLKELCPSLTDISYTHWERPTFRCGNAYLNTV